MLDVCSKRVCYADRAFSNGGSPDRVQGGIRAGGLFLSEDPPLDRSEVCSLIVIHQGA